MDRLEIDPAARTFNCSVVFVDLVGYAKKSVAEQIAARDTFNHLLSETLGPIPEEGRIVLDTGDGAAMSFLDDPEDALYAGMALRQLVADLPADSSGAATNVRIGINLGPVQIGQDAGGQTTIVGDGLNTAEQIMGFAPPGQIAVSKSFYEKVSKLSGEYSNLFRYEGSRTDKHVRDHEIYQLGWSDDALEHARGSVAARKNPPPEPVPAAAGAVPASMAAPAQVNPIGAPSGDPLGGLIDFLEDNTKVGFAAAVLGAIILAQGILLYMKWVPDTPRTPPVVAQQTAPAQQAEPAAPPKTEPEPPTPATPPVVVAGKTAPDPGPGALPKPEPAVQTPAKAVAPVPAKESEKAAAKESAAKTGKPVPAPIRQPAEPTKTAPRKTEAEAPKTPARKLDPPKETKPAAPAAAPSTPARQEPAAPAASGTPVKQNGAVLGGGLVPLTRTPVDFPKEAVREGITSGIVKARLSIDAAGNVTQVDIVDSRPARVFDRAVRGSLARWKFAPGADNRSYEIEIDFKK